MSVGFTWSPLLPPRLCSSPMTSTQEIADRHDSRSCEYSPFRPWDEGNSQCFPFAESNDLSDDTPANWITNSDGEEHRRISFEIQDQEKTHQGYSDSRYPTRVCSDCNTTKTPLWRSGPQGPKSLCNACGIRLRKARRAKAAALNAGLIPAVAPSKVQKEKTSASQRPVPFKKRCRLTPDRTGGGLVFEDFAVGLGKSSACHRLFPQDEKEAALLLMALSSGLIRG